MAKKIENIIFAIIIAGLLIGFIVIVYKSLGNKRDYIQIEFDTLENIKKSANDALKKKYDNLILPDKVTDIEATKLYTYEENYDNKYDKDKAYGEAIDFYKSVTGIKLPKDDTELKYENDCYWFFPKDKLGQDFMYGFYMHKNMFWMCTEYKAYRDSFEEQVKKAYMLKWGDELDDEVFDIDGEEYTSRQAYEFAMQYVADKKLHDYFDENVKIEPYALVVRTSKRIKAVNEEGAEYGDDTNIVKVYFDVIWDGVPLHNLGPGSSRTVDMGYFKMANCSVTIDQKNHVGGFECSGHSLVTNKQKTEDKYVTLESCLDITSKYLAGESNYKVKEVGIRYCTLVEDPKNQTITYRRPYWRIVLDGKVTAYDELAAARTVFVDMITGDLYLFDDATYTMLGELKAEYPQ